jgi:hypothetical protein
MVTRICSAFIITGSMMAAGSVDNEFYLFVIYALFGVSVIVLILTFYKGKDRDG